MFLYLVIGLDQLLPTGGVDFENPKSCFVGKDVSFDTVAPNRIHIGEGCTITTRVILTHYYEYKTGKWFLGDVVIGNNVFIGANSVITKPVVIGDGALIGAGSVVTKNIPNNEVWAGNPAHFICKIEKY